MNAKELLQAQKSFWDKIAENPLKLMWYSVNWLPAYQHLLSIMGYSEKDLNQMADWDIEELEILNEKKKIYDADKVERDKQFKLKEQELIKDIGEEEVLQMRLTYLKDRRDWLEKTISDIFRYDKELKQKFFHPIFSYDWLRIIIINSFKPEKYQSELRKINFEINLKENKEEIKQQGITPDMIARAKEFPFERLVEVNGFGYTRCPYHNEKTASFYINKNNTAYCFGCNKFADVIQYVMDTQKISFIDAVKKLQ